MSTPSLPEYWLRGPVPEVPALLQPVAHALLQARDEITVSIGEFPDTLLWNKPAGMASPGFHLQHLTGVLDRLFTYAQGNQLSEIQLTYLANEGKNTNDISVSALVKQFNKQVDDCLAQLINTDPLLLTEERFVGRKKIASTVIGLLFHAAEHTMRHTGQLIVTVALIKSGS